MDKDKDEDKDRKKYKKYWSNHTQRRHTFQDLNKKYGHTHTHIHTHKTILIH